MHTSLNGLRVLLLENIHPSAADFLRSAGLDVKTETGSLETDELIAALKGVHALGIRSKTQVPKKVFEAAPQLLAVGAFCIGTDQIELASAAQKGVVAFNAPYSNTRSVAEMVLSEMIALSRQLFPRSQKAHQGIWDKSAKGSREVRGKALGIIGYGNIGSQLGILAEALGMTVLFYDVVKKLPLGNAKQVLHLSELLSQADFVTLHVPDTSLTRNMISIGELKSMKKGSYLINASRGQVVDISALAQALKEGQLAGAAVDVFPREPLSNSESFQSELQGLSNVILTPHIGGSTEEAQEAIGKEVADSLLKFLRWGTTLGSVNFPSVDLSPAESTHRVLNVHRNVPGVLRDINEIVSSLGGNIKAQSLATDSDIGFLLMDLERIDGREAADRIKALPTNVRTRLLY